MNGLLGLGWLGWIVALAIGFAIGGVYFITMKLEVEYVVDKRGPDWLLPAALYARLALIAAVLITVATALPRKQVAGAVIGGLIGTMLARVVVARAVRRNATHPDDDKTDEGSDGEDG